MELCDGFCKNIVLTEGKDYTNLLAQRRTKIAHIVCIATNKFRKTYAKLSSTSKNSENGEKKGYSKLYDLNVIQN